MKELSTMLSFDHPNVMSLIGTCFDRDNPLIIMPFMCGSVIEHVKQHKEELLILEVAPVMQVNSCSRFQLCYLMITSSQVLLIILYISNYMESETDTAVVLTNITGYVSQEAVTGHVSSDC